MACGAFNKGVTQYAQLTADSRLKVWEVSSGSSQQEFSPPGHLAAELTCVGWCLSSTASSASKSKKQQKTANLLAIGTAQGHVLVWDCARGEMKCALGGPSQGSSSRVNDVAFGANGAAVYACTDDCQVTCWNVSNRESSWSLNVGKQPCKRIVMHPDEDALATGGTAIKVWDLSTQVSKRKYTGHASAVTCLVYSPDSRFLLSAAGDRFISLWDASDGGTEKNAIMVFTSDSAPCCLRFAASSGDVLSFLAVAQSGSLGVWRVPAPDSGKKLKAKEGAAPLAAQCHVTCEGKSDKVMHAAFDDEDNVLICRGSQALPLFEKIDVEGDKGKLKDSLVLSKREGGLLLGKKTPKKKSTGDATMEDVVGVADMPINNVGLEAVRIESTGGKKRRVVEEERDAANDLSDDDAGSMDEDETLEDKVRALGLDAGKAEGDSVTAPKADSVHAMLMQALQSDDKSLLEQCLAVTNHRVINATVARLPPKAVSALLSKICGKFQAKPTRSVTLVTWIRAILTQHTSYLMSQPDVVKTLTPFYQLVESRVSTYHKLLKLEGRLELALNQVSNREPAVVGKWKEPDLLVTDEVDEVVGVDGDQDSDEDEDDDEEGSEDDDDDDDDDLDDLMDEDEGDDDDDDE